MKQPSIQDRAKFDADLRFGKGGETLIAMLGTMGKYEVKRDREWSGTGNMFIEFEDGDRKTGISVTTADYWCYIFDRDGEAQAMFWFRVPELKYWLESLYKERRIRLGRGGDTGTSTAYLLPITMSQLVMRPIPQ